MSDTELAFFESLPRSRGAASALLRDEVGRVLLVKPTYKPMWGLPGGTIEQLESPLTACRRECAEELGFVPRLTALVGVDWVPPRFSPDHRPATAFVFAGTLAPGEFESIRLPEDELSDARLVEPADLAEYLPEAAARRISACLKAEHTVYLEHGRPLDWT
ncbi:NUDIX domain-containing protein [Marinitenerispora sediminis]|uniref:NUDIX hydrolase n=1 Tax=Marinitenerispora sediminis TaxID=1931232 RepID=A0A368TAP4_9ACTN|nr:NUDIX hydrolase [Marinitenerispora sediminis]RCV53384.1 NUDIX hydrolase [Marinitenerispora sediminis]RCV58420.1 NUDIX hydrolase [Marinitenerispora sediminis]RCV61799.1 NUDIX hydrolase [Marinitenerispora sediminis]